MNIFQAYANRTLIETCLIAALKELLDFKVYQDVFRIRGKYNGSFWDSLIVASALDNKCTVLYSEDMQHGLLIDNKLKVVNPLAG